MTLLLFSVIISKTERGPSMKAISIRPDYAGLIFAGDKTIECRTWQTDYRGDLLICSTAKKLHDTIPSHALCVVTLEDILPFRRKHLKAACMRDSEYSDGTYAWILNNLRIIRPFSVKGKLSLFDVDAEIEYLSDDCPIDYWEPLFF